MISEIRRSFWRGIGDGLEASVFAVLLHLMGVLVTSGLDWVSSPVSRVLGSFGPSATALFVVAITDGRAGLHEIGRRMLIWRVNVGRNLVTVFGSAAILLQTIGIHRLLGGSGLQWNDPNQWYLIIPGFLQLLPPGNPAWPLTAARHRRGSLVYLGLQQHVRQSDDGASLSCRERHDYRRPSGDSS
jgi:hypothetical protein